MGPAAALQTKKQKKLVPNNPEKLKIGERRSGRLKAARDLPREGGFGRGQPLQKPKSGIPSEAFASTSQALNNKL